MRACDAFNSRRVDASTCGMTVSSRAVAGAQLGVGKKIHQLADRSLSQQSLWQGFVDLDVVAVAAAVLVLDNI
jgi:hypothetical protein